MIRSVSESSRWCRGRVIVGVIFFVVWGLITHGTFAGSGDEPHYMMISHSIAFDGDLDLRNNYASATLIGAPTLLPELHVRERNGALYPAHDVGWPFLMAPILRVSYPFAEYLGTVLSPQTMRKTRLNKTLLLRHQMSLVMAVLTGLLAREVFLILLGLGLNRRSAFAWALLFGTSPPILAHSFLVFTEIPTALTATFTARRLIFGTGSLRPLTLVLLGVAAGFMFLIHARNAGLVFGVTVAAVLAAQAHERTRVAWQLSAGIAIAIGLRTVFNYSMWGTVLTTPHASFGAIALSPAFSEMFVRVSGLAFDREYGLLAYAPLYFLSLAGCFVLLRQLPLRLSAALLIIPAIYLLPVISPWTNIHGWTGGWSPAARFLVPIAAFLFIPLAVYWRHASRFAKTPLVALVIVQVAVNAYLWEHPGSLWNDGDGRTAFAWASWLPSWREPGVAATFGMALVAAVGINMLLGRRSRTIDSHASGA